VDERRVDGLWGPADATSGADEGGDVDYEYKDIASLTRIAVAALWISMTTGVIYGIDALYEIVISPRPAGTQLVVIQVLAVINLLAVLVTFVIVGRWIYRASVNAHVMSDEMTITPGWAVGWYFIPFANLVKPFQAMKETWLASHFGQNAQQEDAPSLLNWWWGLWIVTNVLGNISMRTGNDFQGQQIGAYCDFAAGVVNVALTVILVSIMKQIMEAQNWVRQQEIFA
jgi:hypothetical protein